MRSHLNLNYGCLLSLLLSIRAHCTLASVDLGLRAIAHRRGAIHAVETPLFGLRDGREGCVDRWESLMFLTMGRGDCPLCKAVANIS